MYAKKDSTVLNLETKYPLYVICGFLKKTLSAVTQIQITIACDIYNEYEISPNFMTNRFLKISWVNSLGLQVNIEYNNNAESG